MCRNQGGQPHSHSNHPVGRLRGYGGLAPCFGPSPAESTTGLDAPCERAKRPFFRDVPQRVHPVKPVRSAVFAMHRRSRAALSAGPVRASARHSHPTHTPGGPEYEARPRFARRRRRSVRLYSTEPTTTARRGPAHNTALPGEKMGFCKLKLDFAGHSHYLIPV